jgi:hypothetical protein
MLRCGEKVQVLPPAKEASPASDPHREHRTNGQAERGA